MDVLDLSTTDAALKGFSGGFASGGYGYLVPHFNGRSFGKLVRVNLDYFGVCGLSTQTAKGNTMYIVHQTSAQTRLLVAMPHTLSG